jgi:hypothetical protein
MQETESLGPCRSLSKKDIVLRSPNVCACLFLVLMLAGWGAADEAFWVPRKEPLQEKSWVVFVPRKEELAKQAILIYAELPNEKPVLVREILSQMYHQVKALKVLGRKPVPWRQGEGTLVSFSGQSGKKKIVGRAVIASTDRGTEVLLLVRHPRSDSRILENYEQVRQGIDNFLAKEESKE